MPDKYTTDLAVMHVALNTVTMPSTPSRSSRSRTLGLSRAWQPQRGTRGGWQASAGRRGSARVLAQHIILAGHPVFHTPSGSYDSLHTHACPTDHGTLGSALESLSSLALLDGLSG